MSVDMLDDLELGYAITVHKAQGSQWPRVIVPVTRHRMLDRALLYTAMTRAQRQVLLVGDAAAARAAVLSRPRAQTRQVGLNEALAEFLATTEPVRESMLLTSDSEDPIAVRSNGILGACSRCGTEEAGAESASALNPADAQARRLATEESVSGQVLGRKGVSLIK